MSVDSRAFRLCQIHLTRDGLTETFARRDARHLPCHVSTIEGETDWPRRPRYVEGAPIESTAAPSEVVRRARRVLWEMRGLDVEREANFRAYAAAFRRARCDAVLAEYGTVAVQALDACRHLGLPLMAHFHGYDAYSRPVIDRYSARYAQLFRQAVVLIVPSRHMRERLIALGAPAEKTHFVPNGVDPARFDGGSPERAEPILLSVGRFVDKKAPQLTIAAFARAQGRHPKLRLRMIGGGPLRGACEDLARGLGIGDAVAFLGEQSHETVAHELRQARAFVQHSLVATDGDSEGMPNSILEASATGIPAISTRHAGIPEAIVDGETGLLVDEHDVESMALDMERLASDPALAAELGARRSPPGRTALLLRGHDSAVVGRHPEIGRLRTGRLTASALNSRRQGRARRRELPPDSPSPRTPVSPSASLEESQRSEQYERRRRHPLQPGAA